MKTLIFFAPLLAAAIPATAAPSEAHAFAQALAPGQVHEECMHLDAGEKRDYSWKTDAPVDFNIHYHHEPKVFFPVKRDAMRGDGGTFTAKTAQDYCWMWTARDKAAKLEGRIETAKP